MISTASSIRVNGLVCLEKKNQNNRTMMKFIDIDSGEPVRMTFRNLQTKVRNAEFVNQLMADAEGDAED